MSVKKTDVMRYTKATSTLPDKEGLLVGYFVSNGTLDEDGFTAMMSENRPNIDQPASRMMLRALWEVIGSGMGANPCRYSLGPVSFDPMVFGSAPAVNSPLAEGQYLGIGVRFDEKLRNCLSDIEPICVSQEFGDVRLMRVMDEASETPKVIDGVKPFVLSGVNITASAEGETIRVVHDGGAEVEAQVVSESGPGQRIVARLATPLPAGKARICLATHGFGAASCPGLIPLELGVTILAGETPPEPPVPTGPTVTAINSGTFLEGGGCVVHGENMRFADEYPGNHVIIKDSEGTDMGAMISTDESIPVTEESFGLTIDAGTPFTDGAAYVFQFEMLDEGGQPVTVTQTARYVAE